MNTPTRQTRPATAPRATLPRYLARLSGSSWNQGPAAEFRTIIEAREWAESYGTTADRCTIEDRKGRTVGLHVRDTSGNGARWYRAAY